jgi:hypothetical protein
MKKTIFIFSIFAAALGYDVYPYSQIHQQRVIDYHAHPHYKYEYGVHDPYTGDHKTAYEHRDGDKVTGMYSFLEADGRTRIVEYTADDEHGFHAVVRHIGAVDHPEQYQYHHEFYHNF